jgi:hypothetical protein
MQSILAQMVKRAETILPAVSVLDGIHLLCAESWAVIAYQHTFSGHQGPHVPWEHPEMVAKGRDIFTIRARSVSRTVPPPGMSTAL